MMIFQDHSQWESGAGSVPTCRSTAMWGSPELKSTLTSEGEHTGLQVLVTEHWLES